MPRKKAAVAASRPRTPTSSLIVNEPAGTPPGDLYAPLGTAIQELIVELEEYETDIRHAERVEYELPERIRCRVIKREKAVARQLEALGMLCRGEWPGVRAPRRGYEKVHERQLLRIRQAVNIIHEHCVAILGPRPPLTGFVEDLESASEALGLGEATTVHRALGAESAKQEHPGGEEGQAISLLVTHPEWTVTQLAKQLGMSRQNLYKKRKSWRLFDVAWKTRDAAAEESKRSFPRGSRSGDGQIEAYER